MSRLKHLFRTNKFQLSSYKYLSTCIYKYAFLLFISFFHSLNGNKSMHNAQYYLIIHYIFFPNFLVFS